jgi:hypothetical protein
VAVAADACTRFCRSGESIAAAQLYQGIIGWLFDFVLSFLKYGGHYPAPARASDRGALLFSQAQVREFVCKK